MELPLSDEETRILKAVLEDYLSTLKEEMVKTTRSDRNAAMVRVETIVNAIGRRLA